MAAPYSPLIHIDNGEYYPPPYSEPQLSPGLRYGLIPITIFATLSVISTLALICFLLYRFITWRQHYRTFIGYNQYVVLVLNLVIADLQQSSAFLVSFHWIRTDQILAPSPACFAQGWLLHSGDVGSGFFVLAIAVHTFYTVVNGRRIGNKVFAAGIIGIWIFAYFLTAIGVILHRNKYFVRAGAWCWVSAEYETDRLWFHYIWIFIIQFSTVLIYLFLFAILRRRTRQMILNGSSAHLATIRSVNRVTLLMMLYPCVYVVLTLPLSAGRMWSMAHGGVALSNAYACVAGALITSCGWVDSLLYTLTRKRLLNDTMSRPSSRRPSGNDGVVQSIDRQGPARPRAPTTDDDIEMSVSHKTAGDWNYEHSVRRVPSLSESADPILKNESSVVQWMRS